MLLIMFTDGSTCILNEIYLTYKFKVTVVCNFCYCQTKRVRSNTNSVLQRNGVYIINA